MWTSLVVCCALSALCVCAALPGRRLDKARDASGRQLHAHHLSIWLLLPVPRVPDEGGLHSTLPQFHLFIPHLRMQPQQPLHTHVPHLLPGMLHGLERVAVSGLAPPFHASKTEEQGSNDPILASVLVSDHFHHTLFLWRDCQNESRLGLPGSAIDQMVLWWGMAAGAVVVPMVHCREWAALRLGGEWTD